MRGRISRKKLQQVEEKAQLYIRANRLLAAEKLLNETLKREPNASNIRLLLASLYQQQSNYPKAVGQLTSAISANPNFLEASITLCSILCDLGQYDEARELYDRIKNHRKSEGSLPSTIRGRLANLHAENGMIYEKTGLIPEAAQEFTKALALFSDMPDIRLKLAEILIKQGHNQKAQRELKQLLAKDPNHAEALAQLGLSFFNENSLDLARDNLKKSLVADPNNQVAKAYSQLLGA